MVTRTWRRCASRTTAANSSGAIVCVSPHVLSASLIKSTPCLHCRRTSVIISSTLLASTPMECSGVPTQEGSLSMMLPYVMINWPAQASRDGIAQRHINEPGATRHGKAGHPAAQDLLRIACRPEGAESRVGGTTRARDVRHLREPKGEMTVTIDEPGHDPLLGGINDLHMVLIFDPDIRRELSDTPNAIALDDNGVIDRGWTS